MVYVTVIKNSGHIRAVDVAGHAGFASFGKDIVCSAVSVLVQNTVNSILEFCEDKAEIEVIDGRDNYIHVDFEPNMTKECKLLVDSMMLGLTGLSKTYSDNISLDIKEV